jgi:hypothetical protein
LISVCWRLNAAVDSMSLTFHGNQTCASVNGMRISYEPTSVNQFNPAPSKIALYVLIGLLPVVIRTTTPPIRKARKTVSSGTTIPPAFWASA